MLYINLRLDVQAFTNCLREDASTKRWLNQLMFAVGVDPGAQPQQMPGLGKQ